MYKMASNRLFVIVKEEEHKPHENVQKAVMKCLCCLSQTNRLINMNTCVHTAYIRNIINHTMIDLNDTYVCTICHTMLKKIEVFKQQIEESITLLTSVHQNKNVTINKFNNLINCQIHTIDSTEDSFNEVDLNPIVVEVNQNHFDSDVKSENEYDFEADIPLIEEENKSVAKHVYKYEGKIQIVMLTLEELREERERLAKQEKYLRLPYRCEDCIMGFDHEITWKSHMEKRHTKVKGSYQCNICKSVLTIKSSYTEHMKRHLRRLDCMVCGKRYTTQQAAILHYDEKHLPSGSSQQRGYTCRECGFTTTLNRSYRYHMDKHNNKRKCNLCSKTFSSENSLRMHNYTVHKQSSRVYRCEPCAKTYNAKSGLVAHTRSAHAMQDRAYCVPCRTYYMSHYALKTHLKTHSRHVTDTDKRFICDECGGKFLTKPSLQAHINWEHLKVNVHGCDVCSKVFRNTTALRRHVNYVHKKERPPRNKICHFCGRGFFTQNILQSHLRTHTGERPLECQHCRATFAHSGALHTHIKLKHNCIK